MRNTLTFAVLSLVFLTACGGSSPKPTNPPVQVGTPSFLYVNTATGTISGFTITGTGTLIPVSGSPVTDAVSSPQGMTASSSVLYVAHPTLPNIASYTFDGKTGALTRVPGSPFSLPPLETTNPPQSLALCGGSLYGLSDSAFAALHKLNSDGSLGGSSGASGTTGHSASIAVTPSCKYLYFADPDINAVSAYTITGTTLGFGFVSTFESPVAAGTTPLAVALDSTGKFLYVANSGSNDISAFTIDSNSGALTPVPGSPFAAGSQPSALVVAGSYVFVANAGDNTVSAYRFENGTGALTPVSGSPFSAGVHPAAIAFVNTNLNVSPTGLLLFIGNQGSNNVSGFVVRSGGVLEPMSGSPFAVNGTPQAMVVATGPQ